MIQSWEGGLQGGKGGGAGGHEVQYMWPVAQMCNAQVWEGWQQLTQNMQVASSDTTSV